MFDEEARRDTLCEVGVLVSSFDSCTPTRRLPRFPCATTTYRCCNHGSECFCFVSLPSCLPILSVLSFVARQPNGCPKPVYAETGTEFTSSPGYVVEPTYREKSKRIRPCEMRISLCHLGSSECFFRFGTLVGIGLRLE